LSIFEHFENVKVVEVDMGGLFPLLFWRGVVASLRDAERFLSAAARKRSWSVPSRARTFLAPAEMPNPRRGMCGF